MRLQNYFIFESKEWDNLKKNRVTLSPEEREQVMKAGAVWHHGPNGEESPAVWKSFDSKGVTKYICNTHRACAIKRSLEDAIKSFKFIETTS